MTETPHPYGNSFQTDIKSQYERLFEAACCRTQVELAEILEIKQSSVSDAKSRNTIPSDWLIKLLEKKRISPDWIRYGVGSKFLDTSNSLASENLPNLIKVIEQRPPEDCSIETLFTEIVRRTLNKLAKD